MTLLQLLQLALPYRRRLLLAGLLMLGESLATLGLPLLGGAFAASLFDPQRPASAALPLLILGLLALLALLRYANQLLMGHCALYIGRDLRQRLYTRVLGLPLAWFQQHRQGDLLALLSHEVDDLAAFIGTTLLSVPTQLLIAGGAVLLMFTLDPRLALLVSVLVPLFYLLLRVLGRHLRALAEALRAAHAANLALLDESLGLMLLIKLFTRETVEAQRHQDLEARLLEIGRRQLQVLSLLEPALQLLAAAAVLLLLWLGGGRLAAGALDLPELVSLLFYAVLLTQPVANLAGVYGEVQVARGEMARLREVFEEAPEQPMPGTTLPQGRGEIEFSLVHFAWPGRAPLLRGLDLRIAVGETVALVGTNGCGKSTLVHLLLRLQRAQAGSIRFDGVDVAELDAGFLRRQVAVVSQQVLLADATIAANIRYADPSATAAEIERVARLACLHDFVAGLPLGYETPIGEKGLRLSGGQQQRLALARALLKRAPVLVLDEATAMFDPAGERAFLESCRSVLAPLTVLLITHRPASLAIADRVLRLEDGRLVELDAAHCAQVAAMTGDTEVR